MLRLSETNGFKGRVKKKISGIFHQVKFGWGEDVLRVTSKKSIISDLIRWSKNENELSGILHNWYTTNCRVYLNSVWSI